MTKPNKIRIKVTAGIGDLMEVQKYLEKFEQESAFKNTNQKLKQRGSTPLFDLHMDFEEQIVIKLPKGSNLTRRSM
tara:strand:+ start:293 stop:520 length:228 start_codon:yes stop_codon:yes gene_type:complete